jgi:serine/threonine protein kinase
MIAAAVVTDRDSATPPPGQRISGPPVLSPGEVIAPGYQVIEHLRRGEDLDSYEAWSTQRYCRCFIKTLRPDTAADTGARRHLLREARLLLSLSHPHLVRAYECVRSSDDQAPVLVLENLTGATLNYILRNECPRLGVADLSHLGQQVCSALRYLHGRGYLHLDINPGNIIASHGVARLIDLSLARRPGRAQPGMGTPGYLAPEQVHGGQLGPPTDVWGLGLVLYQAATGTQPFDIDDGPSTGRSFTTLSRCAARLDVRPPKVRARRRLPIQVAAAIDACLALDPAHRPSLEQLADTLATLTQQPGTPTVATSSRSP